MKVLYFVATAFVGAIMFWVGFQLRPVLAPWEQQEAAAVSVDESVEVQQTEQSAVELAAQGYLSVEELKIRINDGDVQWFDGMIWHTVASMEELAKEDKFYIAQESFLEFEEQIKQQREERRVEQESSEEQEETLLVGQKETPKPAVNSRPTNPTASDPADSSEDGGSNGGNSGSGNSGGGNSGGNGGEANPGGDGGNSGEGGSAGDSDNAGGGDSGGDTGDGENMEWSDDYL